MESLEPPRFFWLCILVDTSVDNNLPYLFICISIKIPSENCMYFEKNATKKRLIQNLLH